METETETEIVFINAGESWSQEEDDQLNKLYNVDMLDIIKISKIHNRAPGGIISRLCKNNYIPNRILARGYMEYKNSDLYQSIVASGKARKRENKEKKQETIIKPKINDNTLISITPTGKKNETNFLMVM